MKSLDKFMIQMETKIEATLLFALYWGCFEFYDLRCFTTTKAQVLSSSDFYICT